MRLWRSSEAAAPGPSPNSFTSDTARLLEASEPRGATLAVRLLALMLVVAAALLAVVPVDRVVVARGRIVTQAPAITVQPLDTASIRSVEVREGAIVRRGAVLARLDPTLPSADVAQLETNRRSIAAQVARLEAEIGGSAYVAPAGDPDAAIQESMARHRRAELEATLAGYDQRALSTAAMVARAEQDSAAFRQRLAVLRDIEGMRRELRARETGSRLAVLIATDQRIEVERGLATSDQTVTAARHQLEALRAEREGFVQKRAAELAEELATKRVELDRIAEELAKARHLQELVELRAVEDSIVLDVAELAPGAVVRSGDRIMTLLPLAAPLEIEALIAASDQGFVTIGDHAVVKLDGFRYLRHGTVDATVRVISGDAFVRPSETGADAAPVYRVLLTIDRLGLRDVPEGFRLVPGMPLSADIVVGSRTLAGYLLEGALRPLAEGMREP